MAKPISTPESSSAPVRLRSIRQRLRFASAMKHSSVRAEGASPLLHGECVGIGKIGDIFAQKGLTRSLPSKGNRACTDSLCEVLRQEFDGLVMCNLVDFDMQYGHRRDCAGYAGALETFDAGLPGILGLLRRDDMLIVTADHGCDPAWRGTDHTREYIPVLCFGEGIEPGNAGTRAGFGCVGATAAKWLGVRYTLSGISII